ncbi:hypothetical protein SteCoe_34060 [Stentor coeruleus]|uniref:Uncharacterized protein n=1 Tax=Stentor coeruleus TaxID=5963 RepID=A0A1R2AVJ9_9CILI|nr:hypothetical protein SteCoe_34060 [Stentor coeruleus]
MSQADKLVVYYSCFNYEIDSQDFSHIDDLKNLCTTFLSNDWLANFQKELELLNISLAKYSIELCCEVYLSLIVKNLPNTYTSFKELFIFELSLSNIWTPNNTECCALNELLEKFYLIASTFMVDQIDCSFKLLPSFRKNPELQPLVVAEEAVTTLSGKICHFLKKVSLPLENLIGPEISAKISGYINKLSSRVIKTHQVTSTFVTNIIEIKPYANNVKVRVIQPAKEFYDKVIDSWITISDHSNSTSFLLDVRQKLGSDWNEKYVYPALCFYETAKEEWVKAKDIGYNYFLRRMQGRLIDMWRHAIIETSKIFQEHMITKTII